MPKANVLRRLKINEVSSVDRGAGEGVKIMLMKRQVSESHPGGEGGKRNRNRGVARTLFDHQQAARAAYDTNPKTVKPPPKKRRKLKLAPEVVAYLKRNAIVEAQAVAKREFSAAERRSAAAAGHAMSGGGYPINNDTDLHNAVQAIGRAKNPGKTRSHIRRQAQRLGRTDMIPESWGKRYRKALLKTARYLGQIAVLTKNAMSFDEILDDMASTDTAEGVIEAVRDACHALKDSIESIAECDDLTPDDRASAITESFGQFMDHLSGIAPGNITKIFKRGVKSMGLKKQLRKTYTSVPAHDATPPTTDRDAKRSGQESEELTEGKTGVSTATTPPESKKKMKKMLKKALKKSQRQIGMWETRTKSLLTMEKAAKDYMDDPDSDMDEDKKMKFLDMSPKDRAKFMKDNPLATLAQKRMAALPEPVRKELEAGRVANEQVAKMAEETDVQAFAKRATDAGQSADFGGHLRVLAKGMGTEEERMKAFDEVMKVLVAQGEQIRTGTLFKEFGSGKIVEGSAEAQLLGKRDELLAEVNKSGGKRMTPEQAFAKVYEDPMNVELVRQYKTEQRRAA